MTRIDHFNLNPLPEAHPKATLAYDFDFRPKGSKTWRYMNSVDDIDKFDAQIESTLAHGGEYRIMKSRTGEVIKHG